MLDVSCLRMSRNRRPLYASGSGETDVSRIVSKETMVMAPLGMVVPSERLMGWSATRPMAAVGLQSRQPPINSTETSETYRCLQNDAFETPS